MNAYKTLLKTELKLNIRDMNMIIFAVIMPIIVTLIIAVISGSKPAFEGASYTFLEQSFGGLCTIALCAGGLMGIPIMLSEYRHKKILKRFKVTPFSPGILLGVEVSIYFLYALLSVISVYLIARLFGFHFRGSVIGFMIGWFLVLLSMFSMGILVGGVAKDVNQAEILACILYFPMLIFSGATLPYEIMPQAIQKLCDLMPLTQGIKILKCASLGLNINYVILPTVFMCVLSSVCIGICLKYFRWE